MAEGVVDAEAQGEDPSTTEVEISSAGSERLMRGGKCE